jgi:hypothetical protein
MLLILHLLLLGRWLLLELTSDAAAARAAQQPTPSLLLLQLNLLGPPS